MSTSINRNAITWIAYILLSLYAYFLNVLGPITPFLHDEFHLSFTVSSLHFSAFAVGMLVIGLGGHLVINRIGRRRALATGALGLGAGALLLVSGRTPVITIGAAFLMGCIGSLILAVVPAALSEEHGEQRAVAISEANVLSTVVSTSAPLLVGWLAHLVVGWRMALIAGALLSILAGVVLFRTGAARAARSQAQANRADASAGRGLPPRFWFYWLCLVLAVSVEFCMVGWTADFMELEMNLPKAGAAQTVSLFLGGMLVGRVATSRVLRWVSARGVVIASLGLGLLSFLIFWSAPGALLSMAGLFLTGMGVAGLYPLLLSMAIGAANGAESQAGARATLASGFAILALPLTLGRLADLAGLKTAFIVVGVLFVALLLMMLAIRREPTSVVVVHES